MTTTATNLRDAITEKMAGIWIESEGLYRTYKSTPEGEGKDDAWLAYITVNTRWRTMSEVLDLIGWEDEATS